MILDFLFSKDLKFRSAPLEEHHGPIPNPGRGWYQIHYFRIPEQPDFQKLSCSLAEEQKLAMAVVHIGAYRSQTLDAAALDTISRIIDFFGQQKKDLILRFVYDCEGNGLLWEPSTFSVIEGHIRQLSPIVYSRTKVIFILQGLLVGSWGEMHGSKFLSASYLKRLNAWMEAAAGEYTWLAVRKPSQWRSLHKSHAKAVKMGLFDDGILGSKTNLGTFGWEKRSSVGWEDPWCPEDELDFEDLLCRKVPNGGEVVSAQEKPVPSDADVLRCLQRMHVSYLNCCHDLKVLDTWKQKPSPWAGISFYDYVGAHLGYRFCIRKVSVYRKKQAFCLELLIENTGFAPCYEEYHVVTERVSGDQVDRQETPWDVRALMPGSTQRWKCMFPGGKGKLYLSVKRKKDGSTLRFAHEHQENGKLLLGVLEP